MSTHPKSNRPAGKVWKTPTITRTELEHLPYEDAIAVLRSALRQVDKNLSLNPADGQALKLLRALRRMIDRLERSHGHDAA